MVLYSTSLLKGGDMQFRAGVFYLAERLDSPLPTCRSSGFQEVKAVLQAWRQLMLELPESR